MESPRHGAWTQEVLRADVRSPSGRRAVMAVAGKSDRWLLGGSKRSTLRRRVGI